MSRHKPIQPKLRLRDRRRRILWMRFGIVAVLLIVAIGGVAFVSRLPEVTVATVSVTGASAVDAAAVQAIAEEKLAGSYAFIVPKRNTLLAPRGEIAAAILQAYPSVKSVNVASRDLTSVTVEIAERAPSAVWCMGAEGACFFMDEDGFVYREAVDINALVRYSGAISGNPIGQHFMEGGFAALAAFVAEAGKASARTPDAVSIEANGDAQLSFAEGGAIKFVIAEDTAPTLENIASVFASDRLREHQPFEYADFRYGNKVYVKFKGE